MTLGTQPSHPDPEGVPYPPENPKNDLTQKIGGCQKRFSRTSIYKSEKKPKLSIITTSQTLGGTVMMMLAEPQPNANETAGASACDTIHPMLAAALFTVITTQATLQSPLDVKRLLDQKQLTETDARGYWKENILRKFRPGAPPR